MAKRLISRHRHRMQQDKVQDQQRLSHFEKKDTKVRKLREDSVYKELIRRFKGEYLIVCAGAAAISMLTSYKAREQNDLCHIRVLLGIFELCRFVNLKH